jgi:predicted esterase
VSLRAAGAVAAALLAGFVGHALPPSGASHASGADAGVTPPDAGAASGALADAPGAAGWCAPEIDELPDGVCWYAPADARATLAIFLHGVVMPGTTWQWNQQRAAVRAARRHRLVVLIPRGRRGVGRGSWADWWSWPSGVAAQKQHEAEVLAEWRRARQTLEQRRAARFERVWVFGFSAGAYYAASLALGRRFAADGWAVFAGGAAPKGFGRRRAPRGAEPFYVGWGGRDRARRDPERLARELRAAGWPVLAGPRPRVGHTMTDSQLADAVKFLSRGRGARGR